MPMIDADGCLLNVSVEGRDGGPTLMLSNSLGATMQMWEPQMAALKQVFRVIRYDRRGHGKSGVPAGPYSMERLGRDVIAILDDLNIQLLAACREDERRQIAGHALSVGAAMIEACRALIPTDRGPRRPRQGR